MTPLWVDSAAKEKKLVEESEYRPFNLKGSMEGLRPSEVEKVNRFVFKNGFPSKRKVSLIRTKGAQAKITEMTFN